MLATAVTWVALSGFVFTASPAEAKKVRYDTRVAIFVTPAVADQERSAALAKGILREVASFLSRYPYLAGKTLRRKLRGDPDTTISRCNGKVDCIGKLGRQLKVAEVMVGVVVAESGGAVLRLRVVDSTKDKVVRRAQVAIASKDALRRGLRARAAALFGAVPIGRVVIPGNHAKVLVGKKVIGAGAGPFDLPPGKVEIVVGGITHDLEVVAYERTRLDIDIDEPPLLGFDTTDEPPLFVPALDKEPAGESDKEPDDEAAIARRDPIVVQPTEPLETGSADSAPESSVMGKSIDEIIATMPGDVFVDGPLDTVAVRAGPSGLTWGGCATAGLGLIATGAGVYFGLQRQSAQDDLDSLERGPGGDTQMKAERIDERGDRAAQRATIAFAAGGALVASGATLIAVDLWWSSPESASLWIEDGGASAQFAWTW